MHISTLEQIKHSFMANIHKVQQFFFIRMNETKMLKAREKKKGIK